MRQLVSLAVLLASSAGLFAQDFRATVTGQVTDATGAAIPDAKVRAIQRSTNQATEVATDKGGYYTLPFLQPNIYDIEVTATGFQKLRRENVTLLVAQKLDLPFKLEIGGVSTEVTVSENVETVQTADASGGLNFDSLQTSEYPLNGRQIYMLMDLTPGVLFTQEQFGSSGYSGTRGWDVSSAYVMNGGVQGTNAFSLNGAPISVNGMWQVAPNTDAVQEFKVMVNTYDAQIARTGGGSVNTMLKSGTNAWHGTAFDYIRNSLLDANYTQNNQVGAPRGKHITHQFGGTLGGPIRKNKDFVFLSFEGFREIVPFPVTASVPPLDMRDGQHFSNYKINIYDPLTVHNCVDRVDVTGTCASTYIRNLFPGGAIPASRISPIGQKILSFYPAPNLGGLSQNFVYSNSTGKYGYNQPIARWDHQFEDNDRLFFMATFQHGHEYRNSTGIPGAAASGNMHTQRSDLNLITDWTRILSPTAIFDVRASFARYWQFFPDVELTGVGVTAADLGMTQMSHAPTSTLDAPPYMSINSFTNLFGNGNDMVTAYVYNQWNLAPTLTMTRGAQTLKMGLDLVYIGYGKGNIGRANGRFQFTRYGSQQYPLRAGSATSDGSGVADVLLGIPGSGFIDWNDTYYRSWPYAGIFIQNDWKVRRNLTLNLGLRYDVQWPFVERFNRVNSGFDFNAKSPVSDQVLANWAAIKKTYDANPANKIPYPDPPKVILGGKTFVQPGGARRTYNTDYSNIQPRIGVAWQFAPQTVLRTGFGVFHRTSTNENYTDGFSQQTAYQDTLGDGSLPSAGLTGPYSLQNPFPNGIISPSGRELGLMTNIGNGVSFDGRQRPIPTTYQYSFGLQRSIWWRIRLDASYVGSQTVHDASAYNIDYVTLDLYSQAHNTTTILNRTVPNPFYGILPKTSTQGAASTIGVQSLYYPYPEFTGITQSTNPWGKYRYDGLQLRAEKRFTGDRYKTGALTAVFAYTFSKTFQATNRLNNWNLAEPSIHELTQYDKPQSVALSGVWDLPIGKNRHFFASTNKLVAQAISGWSMNYVYRYTSGVPVAAWNYQYLCATYLTDSQTHDHWFNNTASCYKSNPQYTLRTVSDRFAQLRQMDNTTVNVALYKTFTVTERVRFNFKAEAFNLLNHPLYGAPTTDPTNVRFGMLPLGQQNFPRLVQVSSKILF